MNDHSYDATRPQVVLRSTRVKIYANGDVVVLLKEILKTPDGPDLIQTYYLQDDGAWRLLNSGESPMRMSHVYVQDRNDLTV